MSTHSYSLIQCLKAGSWNLVNIENWILLRQTRKIVAIRTRCVILKSSSPICKYNVCSRVWEVYVSLDTLRKPAILNFDFLHWPFKNCVSSTSRYCSQTCSGFSLFCWIADKLSQNNILLNSNVFAFMESEIMITVNIQFFLKAACLYWKDATHWASYSTKVIILLTLIRNRSKIRLVWKGSLLQSLTHLLHRKNSNATYCKEWGSRSLLP